LLATGGLVTQDTGFEGTFTINTVGNLQTINEFVSPGFLVCDTTVSPTILPRQLVAGTGIAITNPGGQSGNTTIAVTEGSTVQQVNVLASNVLGSTQPNLNFIGNGSVSVTVTNDAGGNMANITLAGIVGADINATFITQTPDGGLPNSQALSPLATGLLKVTTGTGVVSHAVANTDYQAASAELTSISSISPVEGSLIIGNGTGYEGFPSGGDPGDVLTSSGVGSAPSWQAPATGNLVVVLPTTTTSVVLADKTTFIARSPTTITSFSYPTTPTLGDVYQVEGVGAGGWQILQSGTQITYVGNATTSSGTGPRISSTLQFDSIIIYCILVTPNPRFLARPLSGQLLIQ